MDNNIGSLFPRGERQSYFKNTSKAFMQSRICEGHTFRTVIGERLLPMYDRSVFDEYEARTSDIAEHRTSAVKDTDVRKIVFRDSRIVCIPIGMKLYFDENWWICDNPASGDTITAESIIRRCQNTLNTYVTQNGIRTIHREPCWFGSYRASGATPIVRPEGTVIDGDTALTVQYNEHTRGIKNQDRFIIGGLAWRVKGLVPFMRAKTMDAGSTGVITFSLYADEPQTFDDMENEIAGGLVQESPHEDESRW